MNHGARRQSVPAGYRHDEGRQRSGCRHRRSDDERPSLVVQRSVGGVTSSVVNQAAIRKRRTRSCAPSDSNPWLQLDFICTGAIGFPTVNVKPTFVGAAPGKQILAFGSLQAGGRGLATPIRDVDSCWKPSKDLDLRKRRVSLTSGLQILFEGRAMCCSTLSSEQYSSITRGPWSRKPRRMRL